MKCLQARDPLPTWGQAFDTENPPEIRTGRFSFRDAANASILALAPYSSGLGYAFEFHLCFQHFLKEGSVTRISFKTDDSSIYFFSKEGVENREKVIREMVGGVHDLQRALCSGEARVQTQDSQHMDKDSTHIAGRSRMDF